MNLEGIAVISAVIVLLGMATGCVETTNFYAADDIGTDAHDAGVRTVDAAVDAADDCTGQCIPGAPDSWSEPELLWVGAESDAPPCPDRAPLLGYEGRAGLTAPVLCDACACDPPTGSCALPGTVTANSTTCAAMGTGTIHTPFDPPSPWDGSCTDDEGVPAGKLCLGNPCVKSLTIAALSMNEAGCAPTAVTVAKDQPPLTWGTFARACKIATYMLCKDPGEMCVPTADPPSSGFRQCISHEGDVDCPVQLAPRYADRHVFYGGVDDTRSCSPCTCGAPAGSACSALISIHADGVCSALLDAATVTSVAPTCHDVPAGSALGSKSAGPVTYTAGACQASGGEASGAAVAVMPATFCCLSP